MALGIAVGAASLPGRVLRMVTAGAASALIALGVSPVTHAASAKITDGKDLLRAMHERYQHDLYVDGKNVFSERYSDIRVNPKLAPAIFAPRQFARRHWEK